MKVFADKREAILTWIIIISFSVGVSGLLCAGLTKTERIVGLVSMVIFAITSIIREELYEQQSKKRK